MSEILFSSYALGSIRLKNRIRFALEVAAATAAAIGPERVAIRLSPFGVFNDMAIDAGMEDTFEQLASGLSGLKLACIHLADHSSMGAPVVPPSIKQKIRSAFRGTLMLSGGYDRDRAETDLADGRADLIAFAKPFISNPRLVTKLRTRAALTAPDPSTFYTPDEKGYTDYPA